MGPCCAASHASADGTAARPERQARAEGLILRKSATAQSGYSHVICTKSKAKPFRVAFHVEGRCARDRACAFLHLEVARPKEDNPSWLDEDLAARKAG